MMTITEQDQAYLYAKEIEPLIIFFGQYPNINVDFEHVQRITVPSDFDFQGALEKIEKVVSHKEMAKKLIYNLQDICRVHPHCVNDPDFPEDFNLMSF